MKADVFDLVRVWAMLTGLVLAGWYFGALYLGGEPSAQLPMLVAAIGGFELYMYGRTIWIRGQGGHG